MSSSLQTLESVGIIEWDSTDLCLWTWSYPQFLDGHKNFALNRCCLCWNAKSLNILPFAYAQYDKLWFYFMTSPISEDSKLNKVTHFCFVLTSKDFNPDKYSMLMKILSKSYDASADPVLLIERYLDVVIRGRCSSSNNGTFNTRNFDDAAAVKTSSVKDAVKVFGLESVYIYTAVLLKKKILVYHEHIEELLHVVRSLPFLAWPRHDWSVLFPWVDDLAPLAQLPCFVAGTCVEDVANDSSIFDVFVNVVEKKIQISDHAKESFVLGKIHKDVAKLLVELSKDEAVTNEQFVEAISTKTNEILSKLRSLGGEAKLSLESIKSRNLNPSTESFLLQLAVVEHLIET